MEEASWTLFLVKIGPVAALIAGFCLWQLRDVNRAIAQREAREQLRESEPIER